MRFGETWSAGVVPEWQAQYIDYLAGKKLIHRLEKEKSPIGYYGSPQSSPIHLPSPALKLPAHERSPLLTALGSEPPSQAAARAAPPGTPSSKLRLPKSALPMTPVAEPKTKCSTFFEWLDSEIGRVNEFYTQQETLTIEKLGLIERELELLATHKRAQKTKTKTPRVFMDMPSLPTTFRPHADDDQQPGDFNHSSVSYSHAKQMLKTALQEYYQSIQHLRGYRSLNETAIRKINKKFDKTFGVSTVDKHYDAISHNQFIRSHALDKVAHQIETLYANTFEHGNHKYAIEKLQSNPSKYPHNLDVLITGVLIGVSFPLFLIALVTGIHNYNLDQDWQTRALLNVWGCWTILALIALLFSLNILAWKQYRVNYPFIFEFDRYNYLDYREYPVMPALMFALLSLFAWLTFCTDLKFARYFPCVFIGVVFVGFMLPSSYFFGRARRWLQIALVRLIFSGAFDVEFRDFFLGDIFCSLNYTLGNISFFFCLYGTHNWWLDESGSARCTSSQSHVLGFLNCLPGIWRWLQCIRRFLDTKDYFPHLFNAAKYSLLILSYMFLSLARIHSTTKWQVCYIVFAALNAIYSSFWDVVMDFSLGPTTLRKFRAFPNWTYWAVMVIDPIMRFNWVLYLVWWNQKQQSDKVSFIVALIEIVRRFIWIFFRVENEHCANVRRFRAFRDLNLPYHGIDDTDDAEPEHELEPVGLTTSRPASVGQGTPYLSVRHQLTFAHTSDFNRRKPTEDDIDDDDD